MDKQPAEAVLKNLFDIVTTDKNRALILASALGKTEIAVSLIKLGADINCRAESDYESNGSRIFWKGATPLAVAQTQTALKLIELGADVDCGRLFLAAHSDPAVALRLIEKGADVNLRNPLGNAALMGHTNVVKALLEKGANINAKNEVDGETPLMRSIRYQSPQYMALMLVKAGADVKAKDKRGNTALHKAAQYGHEEIAQALIEKGAKVNAKAKDGKKRGGITPLMSAAYGADDGGYPDLISILVAAGADVNAKNTNGSTALHAAAYKGHESAVLALLDLGAEIDARNKHGETPLMKAMIGHGRWSHVKAHRETALALVDRGASLAGIEHAGEGVEGIFYHQKASIAQLQQTIEKIIAEKNNPSLKIDDAAILQKLDTLSL